MKHKSKSTQKEGTGPRRAPSAKRAVSGGGVRGTGTPIESRFQAVFESSRDAIGVSKAGIHVFVNPAYLELFGFPPDADLAGKPVLDLIAPESRDHIKAYILRREKGEALPTTYMTRGMRSDGAVFDMEVNVSLYQENGEDHTLVILRDITERKQAEEEIAERGALLQQIMDTANVAIFLVDRSGRITHANRRMAEMFGWALKELVGCEYEELVHPSERETARKKMLALLASEIPSVDLERLYHRKDATQFWGHLAGRRFHDVHGNELGLIGVITDISEHKQAEAALKESEQKYKLLIDATNTGYVIVDEQGAVLDANQEYVRMTGRTRLEDILGRPVTDWTALYDVDRNAAEVMKCMDSGSVRNLVIDYVDAQGKTTPVEINATVLPGPSFARIFTICRDITERMRSEDALKKSEERYRLLTELSPDMIAIHQEGRFVFINKAGLRMLGADRPEQLLGTPIIDVVHPDYRDIVRERVKRGTLEGTKASFIEEVFIRLDGTEVPVEVTGLPFAYKGGSAMIVVAREITERKRSELALKQSEAKYRRLYNETPVLLHSIDGDGILIDVNDYWLKTMGYKRNEVIGRKTVDFLTDASRKFAEEVVLPAFFRDGVVRDIPYQFINKNGVVLDVLLSATAERDAAGNLVRSLAVIEDITERKRAEEALRIKENAIAESINGIALASLDGRLTYVNQAFLAMWGYTNDQEVLGRFASEFWMSPDDALQAIQKIGINNNWSGELLSRKKDGSSLAVRLSANVVKNSGGMPICLMASFLDITEHKHAEEALRENQARLDLALQSAHMGVWSWEIKENRRYFDDLTCQLLGIDAATFTGTAEELFRVVYPEDREKVKAALARTIEQDALYEPAYRIVWPDGSLHYITARGRLVRDDKGQPVRINGIVWDITDQRRHEQELIETEKLESIGTLAGGIAHDFNNLLQGVFGFISMAKITFDQKEKSLAMLAQAEKALHQSVNLTSQLLTFSKGGKPIKKIFALRPLIENSVSFALSGSRISYETVIDENLRTVEADEGQIGQVIQNIVLNAEQSMPLGGMIRVSVRNMPAAAIVPPAELQGDLVEISIRDQGAGIPAEHLTRIFDPYFTTKEKGSGLGLATSYSIIKNHGGLIRVQSEVGKGTNFFIYLSASGAGGEETNRPEIPATTRKGRILVMDDEEIIREVAREMLTAIGHDVAFAETGENALDVYRIARDAGRPFDVVILDLTIRGGMGGKETLLKLMEIDPGVKAVVSSGYSDDAALSNYRGQGFRAFLKKPYNIKELQSTLNALLG